MSNNNTTTTSSSLWNRYLLGALALAATVAVFWFFGDIVCYILVAGVLAIMCQPLVSKVASLRVGKVKVPRWAAALVGVVAMWLVIVAFFVLFIPLISGKVSDLVNLDYQSLLASLREPMTDVGAFLNKYFNVDVSEASLTAMLTDWVRKIFNIGALNNIVSSVFSVAGSVAVAAVSISFIAFYFMKEEGLFLKILLAVAPAKYADNVTRAVDKITQMLSRYFLGVLCQSMVMMLIIASVLMCFGFRPQDAFFVGVIEGVFNIIPYVGPWVGFVLSGLAGMTFVAPGSMSVGVVLLVIAGTVLLAQFVDNYFVSPKIFSRQMNAHPLEIFIVTLVAGSCSGVLGMLIAIPAYTVVRILAKEFLYNLRLVRQLTAKMD